MTGSKTTLHEFPSPTTPPELVGAGDAAPKHEESDLTLHNVRELRLLPVAWTPLTLARSPAEH